MTANFSSIHLSSTRLHSLVPVESECGKLYHKNSRSTYLVFSHVFYIVVTTTSTITTTTSRPGCILPCTCTGVASYTQWQVYSSDTIYITVDTSSCNFARTPMYITSIGGSSSHWTLTGYNAIYLPTNSSFMLYAKGWPAYSSSIMMNYSTTYTWIVNWAGMYS